MNEFKFAQFQPEVTVVQNDVAKKLLGLKNRDKFSVDITVDGFGIRRVDTVAGPHGTVDFSFRLICPSEDKDSWFWVQETQVTQAQWVAIVGSNPSSFVGDDRRPVEQVSFDDIKAKFLPFFELTDDAKKKVPASVRKEDLWQYAYTLPTEAQWDAAAKFDDENVPLEMKCWHFENSKSTTHPVASLAPNRVGLYDILGNVWEWTKTKTS